MTTSLAPSLACELSTAQRRIMAAILGAVAFWNKTGRKVVVFVDEIGRDMVAFLENEGAMDSQPGFRRLIREREIGQVSAETVRVR